MFFGNIPMERNEHVESLLLIAKIPLTKIIILVGLKSKE